MSNKATNIEQLADGGSVVVQGSSQYRGAGSIGGNVTSTTTDSSKGLDLTNANTGNITFGETGVTQAFTDTVKQLFSSSQSAQSNLLSALTNRPAADPAAAGESPPWQKWLFPGIGVALLLALLWSLKRK